jgi:hypothetical protein
MRAVRDKEHIEVPVFPELHQRGLDVIILNILEKFWVSRLSAWSKTRDPNISLNPSWVDILSKLLL